MKDLEAELALAKQKGKEDIQQAILSERESVTQVQWEIDELRRKYLDMESVLRFGQVYFAFSLILISIQE